jgi:G3E family GTPase
MTPLLLVTGFLGAGKTTFLRALLPALTGRDLRARVILNDFRDARVDGASLADVAPDLVALSSSCLCCEDLSELLDTLAGIEGRPGEVVLVEANGATDTGSLLTSVGGAPALDHLTPPLQLAIVDSKRFAERGWQNVMEREQIVTATHLSTSRADLVSPDRYAAVEAALQDIAPRAARVTPGSLAQTLGEIEAFARPLPGRSRVDWKAAALTGPSHRERAHSAEGHFASLQVRLPQAVEADAFLQFLKDLPPAVLRAKGIVTLRDPPGEKRTFQKVEDEAEISPCRLAEPEGLEPIAVFIGPQLPRRLIEERLMRLFA